MIHDRADLAAMVEALQATGDYRILRRLVPRAPLVPPTDADARTAILLDVETTGLDPRKDEVIELGMAKIDYLPDGRVLGLRDVFTSFNESSVPISPEITELTGITPEMVAGRRIDGREVEGFVADAVVVVAHNAGFDRKFAERYWPIFERMAWCCSATEIDWRRHGFEGARLGHLLNGAGLFHEAHRALDDCHALLEVLTIDLAATGGSAFAALLDRARRKTVRIWAEQSPFDLKDTLKRRGYRWSDGNDGRPKSWYVDLDETEIASEIAFLRAEIYLRDFEPPLRTMTAYDRFSTRV